MTNAECGQLKYQISDNNKPGGIYSVTNIYFYYPVILIMYFIISTYLVTSSYEYKFIILIKWHPHFSITVLFESLNVSYTCIMDIYI